MPRETMTPRERWSAVLTGEKPDRVPMDYWATAEASAKLVELMGVADIGEALEKLHVDTPLSLSGRYVGPKPPKGRNIWGVEHRDVNYGSGVYQEAVSSPLAEYGSVEEMEAGYTWPSPDWWDYSHLLEAVEKAPERPVRAGGSEPFLTYKQLRGEEQAFMDLVLEPEIVEYCLDKLYGLAYEGTRRIYETIPGKVMISYVAEDLGGQEDLMYSPDQIRRFFLPWMKKMVGLVHEAGACAFHHSDGAIRKIIPDLIDVGMDVLNPVQWRCKGMAREGLKADFGGSLVFHGAVDNQQTIPFGTAEDVRREVRENLEILGGGVGVDYEGGYIIAPCHNIQAVGPAENVVALYEAGYEMGWTS